MDQARLSAVTVPARDSAPLGPIVGEERLTLFDTAARRAREALAGRAVVNINSTTTGGGVAEMLQTLLGYAQGVGIDARWLVLAGNADFFMVTKRIHNLLHGDAGDGGPLDVLERSRYEAVLGDAADDVRTVVSPGDVVILHDPQTLGLAEAVSRAGAHVVWRCHVGTEHPNHETERAWEFLRRYCDYVDGFVFSRPSMAPPWLDREQITIIPPSIDPFAVKNQPMEPDVARRVLVYSGLLAGRAGPPPVAFIREDGAPGRIDRRADVLQTGPPPPPDVPVITQVSRWDRLKDMHGVMVGFAEGFPDSSDAHLVLAGPNVSGVTDDPEGGLVLDECMATWRELPHSVRIRVHLACLPMADVEENAAMVNALQRHATVVTQKSLAEGFGLTVVEAMWKQRPVVASAVGGIPDQIVDGESGLLIDPTDLTAFGAALHRLIVDEPFAQRLATTARERVRELFLADRHLVQYSGLVLRLLGDAGDAAARRHPSTAGKPR